jgi:hypothetical protein
MPKVVRTVLAVIAGAAVAMVIVTLSDGLVGRIWPLPDDIDVRNRGALREAVSALPSGAFGLLLAGWTAATAAGAYVATRWSPDRAMAPGVAVTALLLAATIINLWMLEHPGWMWPAALILIPAAGWLAARAAYQPASHMRRYPGEVLP